MSHSIEWEAQKQLFREQLLIAEELRSKQLVKYMQQQNAEYKVLEQLVERYMDHLQGLLALSSPPQEPLVLLNDVIEIEYLDDGFIDTYCIVFPDEVDPELGKISLLSPVGSQLLLSPLQQQIELSTPAGSMTIRVINIKQQAA